MRYQFADKFNKEVIIKPTYKSVDFYQGGFFEMRRKLEKSLNQFRGAYSEYRTRTDGLENNDAIRVMWDYIELI